MTTRRDFLKELGAGVGGLILASTCDSGGGTPIPRGYRFSVLLKSGDPLVDGHSAGAFPGVAMINDRGQVVVYAYDETGALGAYKLSVDFGAGAPTLAQVAKLVRQGDPMGDDEVARLRVGSFNNVGSHASVLDLASGLCGVYVHRDETGLAPFVEPLSAVPRSDMLTGEHFYGRFSEVDVDHDDTIVLSATYSTANEPLPQDGVFAFPGGEVSDRGVLLHQEGMELPGGPETVEGFGLLDVAGSNGHYAVQVYGATTLGSGPGLGARRPTRTTATIVGNLRQPGARPSLRAASPTAVLSPKYRASVGVTSGESHYGPRIGGGGLLAQVIHKTPTEVGLYVDGHEVVATGALSPGGAVVKGLGGPVVSDDGLVHVVLFTEAGEELCLYNGSRLATILASGQIAGGPAITSIVYGTVPEMVDAHDRIVFFIQHEDRSRALVVGTPV